MKLSRPAKPTRPCKRSTWCSHGGLPPAIMVKALSLSRHRLPQASKPAQAIADLTSALWLKGGLAGPERAGALKHRTAAYQEAGISNVPDLPSPTFAADPPSTSGWQTAMNGSPVAPAVAGGTERAGQARRCVTVPG